MIINSRTLMNSRLVFLGILMCLTIGLTKSPFWTSCVTGLVALAIVFKYFYVQTDLKHKLTRHLRYSLPDFQIANTTHVLNFSNPQEHLIHDDFVHEENFSLRFTTTSDLARVKSEIIKYFEGRKNKVCPDTDARSRDLHKKDIHIFVVHELRYWSEVDYLVHVDGHEGMYHLSVIVHTWPRA